MDATAKSPPSARVYVAVALIGLSGAWNAGTVGPVASEIAGEFDISLGVVGILAGTLFLGASVAGLMFAAQTGERIGLLRGLKLACGFSVLGNLLFAVTPVFAGMAISRVLVGLAFALMNPLGAVWARNAGGVKMIGVFGASIQLGIALALLVGSGLSDAGVDWRIGFGIAAALAVAAYISIPSSSDSAPPTGQRAKGFLGAAVRHARVYRLSLLFISIYGVPMVLSAWFIEYVVRDGDVRKALAGVIAFLLFGLSAAVRVFGARLQSRGLSHAYLAGSLGLAAIGIGAIVFEPVVGVAFGAVVLIGTGFGIPYATALTEAQDLFPKDPGEPVALMTIAALVPPIIVIPLVGHAISKGDGDIAFGLLAVFVALATLANLRRTGIPLDEPAEDAA